MNQQAMLRGMYGFALDELFNNILPFWTEKVKDPSTGGYHGAFHNDGTPDTNAPRVLILNARLLWTYSSAYRIFGDPALKEEAWYAYRYFMKYFWDKEHIGAYYSVLPDGSPDKTFKLVYGQAFAIYALSEFHRATGHEPALKDAIALHDKLEAVARDPRNDGYWECFSRDWSERTDSQYSMAGKATKSMNTHLHLIEAYTSLLRVYPEPAMQADTRRHFDIMTNKILNRASGHYYMYLSDEWVHTDLVESYGHDIEGSWLMNECAHVIGDPALIRESERISVDMANACMKSLMPDGAMLDEGTPDGKFLGTHRVWWIQAENAVGMLNAWQAGGDGKHLEAAYKQAQYIRRVMSDRVEGEWFGFLDADGNQGKKGQAKVSGWKCPYHNARMCFEIIERYRELEKSESH